MKEKIKGLIFQLHVTGESENQIVSIYSGNVPPLSP